MADVLSQTEVESLLSALDPGASNTTASGKTKQRRTNSQVSMYDFKRPERVSKEQMRAFQALHEGFSREFGAAISGMLRSIIETKLISVDQLTYSEFVFSLENPTCFNLVEAEGLDGHMILDLNPSIIFPIIDRLLGGGKESQPTYPNRAFTEIELRLISRITDLAVSKLNNAWANVCDLGLRVIQVESNPQLVQIVPPNEVVVLVSFELTMGEIRGIMNLCIPFNTIEPLAGKLSSDSWTSYTKRQLDPHQKIHLETGISSAAVEMRVLLAESKLTTSEVANLEVGDIIMTEQRAENGVKVMVEGRPMFEGFTGLLRGHKAVRIGQRIVRQQDVIATKLQERQATAESESIAETA